MQNDLRPLAPTSSTLQRIAIFTALAMISTPLLAADADGGANANDGASSDAPVDDGMPTYSEYDIAVLDDDWWNSNLVYRTEWWLPEHDFPEPGYDDYDSDQQRYGWDSFDDRLSDKRRDASRRDADRMPSQQRRQSGDRDQDDGWWDYDYFTSSFNDYEYEYDYAFEAWQEDEGREEENETWEDDGEGEWDWHGWDDQGEEGFWDW